MFKLNQAVVHRSHGVGVLKKIETRTFGPDNTQTFYIVEINDNGCPKKVFVPTELADDKLRPVADAFTLKRARDIALSTPKVEYDQTWNRRYREYMELIHTGDLLQVAEVYARLVVLQADKDLSFGERKLLEQARDLINAEFTAAGLDTL